MVSGNSLALALSGVRSVLRDERRRRALLLITIFLFGCTPAPSSPTPDSLSQTLASPQATSTSAPAYVDEVRNAQYQLGAVNGLRIVQLTNGLFQEGELGGANFTEVRVLDFVAAGDMNGDGVDEVAALIAENYGGTGVFVFLALYTEQGGVLTQMTSAFLDDRPSVNALSISDGEIFMDVVTHDADDTFCCPTFHNQRRYRLFGTQLDLVEYVSFTPAGDPRSITIEAPKNNAETFSAVQVRGSVTVAPFENNLTYRIVDSVGVELSVGAIQVTAPDLGAPGTFDSVINIGTLLSGTVIRIEIQDISAADGSLLAMDSVELVVK